MSENATRYVIGPSDGTVEIAGYKDPAVFGRGEYVIDAKETVLRGPIVIEDGAVVRMRRSDQQPSDDR
jgi:hypothetical protein